MYKRILLPLDGSPLAEQALPHAVSLAAHCGAELILLMVLQPLPDRGISGVGRREAEEVSARFAREYLEKVAASIADRNLAVQILTIEGQPPAEIVQYAEQNQVDLIVMSTRGQSGLTRWLMGSVADRVIRGATLPVLLVRALETAAG